MVNQAESRMWDDARQRELDREFARTGEQQYMGQGGMGEAYSNMRKQIDAGRKVDIDKMVEIASKANNIYEACAALYDARYRRQ